VCDDGSIFVDRDGEHFGHVLEYMRDGVVTVADPDARPSVLLLRALKREFGFYCIELPAPLQPEMAYVMGDFNRVVNCTAFLLSSMERYDASTGQWSVVAAMGTARSCIGACTIAGELYVTGGRDNARNVLSSVEKYSPSSDTWSAVAPMPEARAEHAAVAVGSAMYVLGGIVHNAPTARVLKFDFVQATWSEVSPMPVAKRYFAACAIGSDIFVFGGKGSGNNREFGDQDSVFKLDTVANAWSTLAPMPHGAYFHSASVLDGQVYIVGVGCEVLRFDPALGAWSTLASTSENRKCGSCFELGGCLYVVGGDYESRSSVERYDVSTNTWRAVADMVELTRIYGAVTMSAGPPEYQDLFDVLIAKAYRDQPARI
jgi:hypothetical protein